MLDWFPTGRDVEGTERHAPIGHDAWFRWFVGVIVPLAVAAYGIWIVATQQTTIGRRGALPLTGANAVAIGVAWIAAALFVHCRYFWDELHDSHWLSELGKIVALVIGIGGLGVVLVRNGIFGIR